MRIFEREDLLYESESVKRAEESMPKLWQLAREIKGELGKDGHYVDDYLSIILKFIGNIDILNLVSISQCEYLSLWTACSSACRLGGNKHNSKYSRDVKKYIKNNPALTDDVYTQTAIYFSELAPGYLKSIINKFVDMAKKESTINWEYVGNLYSKISGIVGESKMDALDNLIKNTFIVCQFGDIIAQEILSHAAGSLSYEDEDHQVAAFKLMIDKIFINKESK